MNDERHMKKKSTTKKCICDKKYAKISKYCIDF